MYWWIPYAISAVVSVAKGAISSSNSQSQADNILQSSFFNSISARDTGENNAEAIATIGGANAQLDVMSGDLSAQGIWSVAKYNAQMKSMIGDYNARLLEGEVTKLWESVGLDITQIDKQGAQQQGQMRVAYGASGAVLDQDSPLQASINMSTEQEFQKLVLRHGADEQAAKLLNAAALSRWEGNTEAQQILLEGKWGALTSSLNSRLRAAGTVVQSNINSVMEEYNAGVKSRSILQEGFANSTAQTNNATSQWISGLLQGGSSLVSSIFKSPNNNTSTTTS